MEFKTLKAIFKHLFNFLVLSSISFAASANVVLVDGHVRAMPASVPNTAAYFTLENHNNSDVKLVEVKTSAAKVAQLHTIIEEDGMVKMRQVEGFTIPSHGSLTLQPTGDHVMLLSLTAPLAIDDKVPLTLIFDDGQQLMIDLPVLKKAETQHDEHHHHN
ncbi:MAG: copper chaperone PCu(A)C [Shewanella psychromarinicola]|jgi:copper(I)-binding protein|uniref:copper chaperone PCu(A)C n=1 Tax=Shewanella psychromarinicola TaxID=2487742 RepID=UPI003002BE03|tara:strand:- start:20553 stop:21032 length:480 start_codon:yes stop_codon:yes gene_type:complete